MQFIKAPKEAVKLKLIRERTRLLKQGYPWIYKDWLLDLPPAKAGSRAIVRDKDGSALAFGIYDPQSPLAVRVCAIEQEKLSDELISERLESALSLRRSLFSDSTSGYRLLNGEGDGLPGLVCDIYGKYAVLKLDGNGPTEFWNLEGIVQWLSKKVGVESVFQKYRSDADSRGKILKGAMPHSEVEFLENGLKFSADLVQGQKTGFFFDQRDNRRRIQQIAKNKKVLNLFAYTGGFSVYAGVGGAQHVTTVDLAKPAILSAKHNWALNHLPENKHEAVAADAFEFLEQATAKAALWDLIIVDPPSFAPAEKHVAKATESYKTLFSAAIKVLGPGGIVALSSCSSHIGMNEFFDISKAAVSKAKRRAKVLGLYGQPEDHPFPLPCTELQYLKFLLLRI